MLGVSSAYDASAERPDAALCQGFRYTHVIALPGINRLLVRPGFQENISEVVEVTRKTVKERLQGDAWIMWAIAQRANLPVKIEACIT